MDARREGLVLRFLANTGEQTRAWPASLQSTLHDLALLVLPEIVLGLDREAACAWVRGWRERTEAPAPLVDPADAAWVAALAQQWLDAQPPEHGAPPPSAAELARLTRLVARLGPLALRLPWRGP